MTDPQHAPRPSETPIRSVAWQLLRITVLGILIGIAMFAVYVSVAFLGI